jgi:AraC-like DNA-binding protein
MDLDAVQRAAGRVQTSPLYGIVSRHLVELTRMAAVLSSSPAAGTLGTSSTLLVSALLAGADAEVPSSREVLEHTLLVQARAYVRHHLREPSLDAESVAIALSVSRRQLFRVCAQAGVSLEQHIISSRLEASKDELASPAGRGRSIAAVAHSWGFKDPTHFSRRFHAAYGLLPGEWRRLASESAG